MIEMTSVELARYEQRRIREGMMGQNAPKILDSR